MSSRYAIALLALACIHARASTPPTAALSDYIQPLGSASHGTNDTMRGAILDRPVVIPDSTHGLTVCCWAAARDCDGPTTYGGTSFARGGNFLPWLFYTPKHENRFPDELAGAWGWGGAPVTVSGTRSINYSFAPFADGRNGGETGLASFPRGVYTCRWKNASTTFTCTFGGQDFTITPGDGERNVDPKTGANGVIISGSGSLSFGFSKIKVHEFFSTGFGDTGGSGDATTQQFNREIVSSNYVFTAHRIRLDQNVHTAAVDIIHTDGTHRHRSRALDLPVDGTRTLGPETMMLLQYYCIGTKQISYLYEWDFRVIPKWLDDDEIMGVYEDGARVRQDFGYLPYVLTNAVHQIDP